MNCSHTDRRRPCGRLAVAAVIALVVWSTVGCTTPTSTALSGVITPTGLFSLVTVEVTGDPGRMVLDGMYRVETGRVVITVTAPDGSFPFDQTFNAVCSGDIRLELIPMPGVWELSVRSPGGSGYYDIAMIY